jgi:hypothetical protein
MTGPSAIDIPRNIRRHTLVLHIERHTADRRGPERISEARDAAAGESAMSVPNSVHSKSALLTLAASLAVLAGGSDAFAQHGVKGGYDRHGPDRREYPSYRGDRGWSGRDRHGGSDVRIGIGIGFNTYPGHYAPRAYCPPVYYAPRPYFPPPVIIQSSPVYYAPPPVVYAPPPVIVQPTPVYYQPAPVVIERPVYVERAVIIRQPAPIIVQERRSNLYEAQSVPERIYSGPSYASPVPASVSVTTTTTTVTTPPAPIIVPDVAPANLAISAFRAGDSIVVAVSGANTSDGYTIGLVNSNSADATLVLRNQAPSDVREQKSTPFAINASLRATSVSSTTITVKVAGQVYSVPISDAPSVPGL